MKKYIVVGYGPDELQCESSSDDEGTAHVMKERLEEKYPNEYFGVIDRDDDIDISKSLIGDEELCLE